MTRFWVHALAVCLLVCSSPRLAHGQDEGRDPQAALDVAAALKADKLDAAIEIGERALARVRDPEVAGLVAEAWTRKAKAAAERDRPHAEVLTLIDRGLAAQRTIKLLKWRGRTLTAMGGREVEAYEAYEEALERGAEAKDQADIVQEMADVYARVAPRMCRATITSEPGEAEVRVGAGVEAKRSPCKWWLPRGRHSVQVFALGRPAVVRVIECGAQPTSEHFVLEPGSLALASAPTASGDPYGTLLDHPEPPARPSRWPLLTAGAGAALVGLGVALNLDYNATPVGEKSGAEKAASLAAYGVGGAALVGGIVWWWRTR